MFDSECKRLLDSHLHQLRTTLSVIDVSSDLIDKKLPDDENIKFIKSSLKLLEVSYENLLFISSFDYVNKLEKEDCNICQILGRKIEEFFVCSQVYEIEFELKSCNKKSFDFNDIFLERIIDDVFVFLIKNSMQKTKIQIECDETAIQFIYQTKTTKNDFGDNPKIAFEKIEKNAKICTKIEQDENQDPKRVKIVF